MNPLKLFKNISPEAAAPLLALLWLIVITLLHYGVTGQTHTKQRLKVGYLPITCHLLLPVAMERDGFFKENVDPIRFSSWPDMIESVKGNELDCAFILAPIAISLMDQSVPVVIALLGHRNGTGLVVAKNSGISSVKDFVGKTFAIPIRYSTQNMALLMLLGKNGIAVDKVNRVELPPPDMPSALASNSIDGYIVGEPYATQALIMGKGIIFKNSSDIWPNFISSLLIVNKDSLSKKRKLIDRFIRGLKRQGKWIEANRKKAADIGADFFGLNRDLVEQVLTARRVSYLDIVPRQRELDEIGKMMVQWHLLKKVPKIGIYTSWQ